MKRKLLFGVTLFFLIFTCLFIFLKSVSAKPQVTIITDKYIFSAVDDNNFIGEGFFVTLETGNDLFIYSKPGDNPHDIENARRKFLAIAKGEGSVEFPLAKTVSLYLATKYDLGMEHRILSADTYRALAEETRKRGYHKNAEIVYFRDINFSENEIKILCKDIKEIDKLTMTTGGSVFIITINSSGGQSLSIGDSTTNPDAKSQLSDLLKEIKNLIGTDKVIVAKKVSYQDAIYTTDGVRSGWVANIADVSIE
ncbi:MAG: hypothetical protein Q8O13_03010 [Candidatus Omnitrophota bacterium]|nr:hypothetical protein [Candidatus Omnitrophota bacterium]